MRALLPAPGPADDVHERYAEGWLDGGGVRANMIASTDGAASADGRSAGLQTPGDNRVFAALRDLADVVLVGSGTAVAERYGPAPVTPAQARERARFGLRPALRTAVVTRTLRLDPAGPLFADPDRPPLLITCAAAAPRPHVPAEVVVCGDADIDFAAVRRELAARGLTRVLCEGGPTLLAALAAAGELDELCLTLSPMLAGPGAGRVVAGTPWAAPAALRLAHVLEEDGALFLRYAVHHPHPFPTP